MKRKRKGKPQPGTPTPVTAAVPDKPSPYALDFSRTPEESERDALGRNAIRPTVGGAMTIKEYGKRYGDNLEVMALVNALSAEAKKAAEGNLGRAEHMLMVQAHTLDAIFNVLARQAAPHFGEHFDYAERSLRLALKAQGQCRATLETLALMKNPAPVAFVRQANIAHGPQQVNNVAAAAGEFARARETENLQSKLLEIQHGERLDARTAGAAGHDDPAMATVGAIDRAENRTGKSEGEPEQLQRSDAAPVARVTPGTAGAK